MCAISSLKSSRSLSHLLMSSCSVTQPFDNRLASISASSTFTFIRLYSRPYVWKKTTQFTLHCMKTGQSGNHRYQTSSVVCDRTVNSMYLLNLSPINAKLTSLSCVHQYTFVSSATYTVAIVTMTTVSCVSAILSINRQISPFLF